jgi:VWFA-related protein
MTRRALPCSVPCSILYGSLLFALALHAQTPTPAVVPTLKANTRIVVVDVVVTDPKQNAVHSLKASDFSLVEKGQPQSIAHFEEHAAMSATAAARMPPIPKLPPGTFTNYSPTMSEGALNILLLDSLNTPMKDQVFVRQQMLKYLAAPRPGIRMAVFGLGSTLHLLQGFTSDPEVLRAVVSGKKGLAKASPLMDHAVSGDTVGADSPMDDLITQLGNDPTTAAMAANLQQFQAETQSFQTMLRTRYTLDALNLLGRYLSGLPGRKNLIWFSGSFPVNILPDGDLQNPFGVEASMEEEFHETINLLSRSQVAVYPIDARGLMASPMMDAANSGTKYANPRNPGAFGKDQSKFFQQTAEEHDTMKEMARDTGGKAFVNTNGLKEAVEKAVDAGANYYTLTYTPTNKNWKGDYRKIEVKLAEQGYTLAYRRGYYADDPDAKVTSTRKDAAATAAPFDPLRSAMQWGGPDPVEILFEASILPASDATEAELAPGSQSAPKTTGPYRRYAVYFVADPKAITAAETAAGKHHIDLQFLSFVYSAEGVLTTSIGKRISADLTPEQYNGMLHGGVRYKQEVSVPAKGEFFLRVGLEDVATQHVGAVEIGVDAVSKLKPLSAQTAAPAKQ